MNINQYNYQDFLVYCLSYFGLSSIVKTKLEYLKIEKESTFENAELIIEEFQQMDYTDRAQTFRLLYKQFYKKNKMNKEKLLSDLLSFCL